MLIVVCSALHITLTMCFRPSVSYYVFPTQCYTASEYTTFVGMCGSGAHTTSGVIIKCIDCVKGWSGVGGTIN